MSTYRILCDNRRERALYPNLTSALLHAAVVLLSLVALLPKSRSKPKGSERLSAKTEAEFDKWLEGQKGRAR